MKASTLRILSVLILAAVLLGGCGIRTIRGSGEVVTEERDVNGFDAVELAGMGQMIIVQGTEESLTIETDDNLMRYIETEVRGGTLVLRFADSTALIPTRSIVYRLGVIDLTGIGSSGAGSFDIDELETDRLTVGISGAGDIDIGALSATEIVVSISGAGRAKVAGQVERQMIDISGVGGYDAPDLECRSADVVIHGGGDVTVWVLDTLDVEITGAGRVSYYGSPDVSEDTSVAGDVVRLGAK
jgi:hypothetical protein